MTDHDDNEREAREQLASRADDFRAYLACDDPDEGAPEELGSIYDYGLEWSKHTTNHYDDTVTYRHVLSTGGPHEEFRVMFDDRGQVAHWTFVSLPWFGRVEIESHDRDALDVRDLVAEFYATNYGDLVTDQMARDDA